MGKVTKRAASKPPKHASEDQAIVVEVSQEDWLCLIEERFRNAILANLLAHLLGPRRKRDVDEAVAIVKEYVSYIRPGARKHAATLFAEGDWRGYAEFLNGLLDFIAPYPVPRKRGRRPKLPPRQILAALRKYDEVLLRIQAGISVGSLIKEYAPELSPEEAANLASHKEYLLAAELAIRGTQIRPKTLIHRYAPKYKTGRLYSIANDFGMWERKGKERRSFRFKKVVTKDGREDLELEPID